MIPFIQHWKWAAMAALGIGWGVSYITLQKERTAHQATHAEYATAREAATANALFASEQIRVKQTELSHVIAENAKTQSELADTRRRAADAARIADSRVRSAAQAYAAAAGQACTNPGTATDQPTAAEALDMLAGLLDRVGSRKTELAEFADAAHDAAAACEKDYAAARKALE